MNTSSIRTVAAALAVLAACDGVDATAVVEQHGDPYCRYASCANSPELTYRGVLDANVNGIRDSRGISIYAEGERAKIYKDGLDYDLEVVSGRIRGRRGGADSLEKSMLVGAEMLMLQDGAPLYVIRIDAVRWMSYPVGPAATVELYTMTWHDVGAPPSPDRHLCNELLFVEDPKLEGQEMLGMHSDELLVFEGDRIDMKRFTMSAPGAHDPAWFNFACGGRALAKLHLTRNTAASLPGADSHDAWRQRQAMLKMLAADYCGTGHPFTVSGTPLVWQGANVTYAQYPRSIEARWDEKGARCLGTPRMLGNAQFDDLYGMIASECSLSPSCANADPWDYDNALLVSSNYLAVPSASN